MHRTDILQRVLDEDPEGGYLEIGVSRGTTFRQVRAPLKVAVDPRFRFRVPLGARMRRLAGRRSGELYFQETSDAFFTRHVGRLAPFRAVLADGLHEAPQTYRDIVAAVDHLVADGVVVVHDCNPLTEAAAVATLDEAQRTAGYEGTWNGDVWKAIVMLRVLRPELTAFVIDADQGLGVVLKVPARRPLELDPEDVKQMGWHDLVARRAELLDLRSPQDLTEMLAGRPVVRPAPQ